MADTSRWVVWVNGAGERGWRPAGARRTRDEAVRAACHLPDFVGSWQVRPAGRPPLPGWALALLDAKEPVMHGRLESGARGAAGACPSR